MVWAISYQPRPDTLPDAEVLEGNRGELALEDMTPDGGVGLQISRSFSGRRVIADSVPKKIKWCTARRLLDYEDAFIQTVSVRLRDLIEAIEPGVHQFVPVEFVARNGSPLGTRWFWQVCNRLDSVHRVETNWTLQTGWLPPKGVVARMTFDSSKIANVAFWHDKHIELGPLITDTTKQCLEEDRITGLRYFHYEQA